MKPVLKTTNAWERADALEFYDQSVRRQNDNRKARQPLYPPRSGSTVRTMPVLFDGPVTTNYDPDYRTKGVSKPRHFE